MSKFTHFAGIDVSKEFFDAVILLNGKKDKPIHKQFENSSKGVKALIRWLKTMNATSDNTLICLEHTGIYGKQIIENLLAFEFSLWVEMSLKIIRSIGVQRGKNDKLDAERIAYYAMKNADEAIIYKAPSETVEKIKKLLSLRNKLTVTKAGLLKTLKELEIFDKSIAKLTKNHQTHTVAGIEKDLKSIEKQLDELVKSDENLSKVFKQATSVPGIGKITALFLICFTNEFKYYDKPRQLACYCGVVPFEHTSGKSIKGRPRVHHMANKSMKKQLHMCALSAVTYDPEMKAYYERKVSEGKSKMLVINNVRNKLVHRLCACIRDDRMYEVRRTA
ncbi:MAG: IS110 family transposase [Marinilabiliales bacterium]|nr:MAG: IS110 family transposase [Marinilabiliales bacterium]